MHVSYSASPVTEEVHTFCHRLNSWRKYARPDYSFGAVVFILVVNFLYCLRDESTLTVNYVSSRLDIDSVTFGNTRVVSYTLVNLIAPADTNRTNTAALVAENVKMYRLDDSGDPMIAPHVGDKVEITGSLMTQKKKSDADSLAPPAPMLKVESLRGIAGDSSSCSN